MLFLNNFVKEKLKMQVKFSQKILKTLVATTSAKVDKFGHALTRLPKAVN